MKLSIRIASATAPRRFAVNAENVEGNHVIQSLKKKEISEACWLTLGILWVNSAR